MNPMLADCSVSISELKKNPTALLTEAEGTPVAILNHNKPTAYLIPAATYEWMIEQLDDYELGQVVRSRRAQIEEALDVDIDDL